MTNQYAVGIKVVALIILLAGLTEEDDLGGGNGPSEADSAWRHLPKHRDEARVQVEGKAEQGDGLGQ